MNRWGPRADVGRARAKALLVGLALTLGCSQHLPPEFAAASNAASAAYSRGHYRAAAALWNEARELAPNARERDEATYRTAVSRQRAGDLAAADALYAELERADGERAARAAFARVDLASARGQPADAEARLLAALSRFPNAGPARNALLRRLRTIEADRGTEAALRESERLLSSLSRTELAECLWFERARRLEVLGQLDEARAQYIELARRFPYPYGAYWDDAWLSAARLDSNAGRFVEATRHLETLLAARETARLSGSYERPAFSQARFRLAEIYRDELDDPARAQKEFRRVHDDHPTSLLGDDALLEAALVARRQGDTAGACRVMQQLVREAPQSRFAACAHLLCQAMKGRAEPCRDYVRRRISSALDARTPRGGYSSSSSR